MACRIRQGARLGVAAAWLLAVAPAADAGLAFTRVEAGALGDPVAALALHPRDGSLIVGDSRGVGRVGPAGVLQAGLIPFIPGAVVKIALAAALLPLGRGIVDKLSPPQEAPR